MKKLLGMICITVFAVCFAGCGMEAGSTGSSLNGTMESTTTIIPESTTEAITTQPTTTTPEEEGNITKISTDAKLIFNDGKFEGWGTGIAWWGNRLGYSDTLTEQAIKLFFDEETGLGMNIVRYNIPGGDDPTHTHITRTDTKMQGFTYYNEETGEYEFDKTVNPNQRNVLFKIKEFCGDKLIAEAYTCSPPFYMTESGCTSGSDKGITNNLKDEYYDDYADYIAEVLRIYKDEYGFIFDSISLMNDPISEVWIGLRTQHEGCHFDGGQSVKTMYSEFADAMNERGLIDDIEVSLDGSISGIYRATNLVVRGIVSRYNLHTGSDLSKPYDRNAKHIKTIGIDEGKNLWITKCDSRSKHDKCTGEMGAALQFANKIVSDMGSFMPAAWVIENAIDYHICAEGYQGNQDTGMPDTVSQSYWGLAVADHDNEKIILTKKYYAYGQFSRYIRPGYTIFADSNDDVLVTYSPDEKKLVIVAVNNAEAETELKISLEAFEYDGGMAKVIRTSGELEGGENWAELPDVEVGMDMFETELKGYSITTFIIDGVTIK